MKAQCKNCGITEHFVVYVKGLFNIIVVRLLCKKCGTQKEQFYEEIKEDEKKTETPQE